MPDLSEISNKKNCISKFVAEAMLTGTYVVFESGKLRQMIELIIVLNLCFQVKQIFDNQL